jgi:hypothetical protein
VCVCSLEGLGFDGEMIAWRGVLKLPKSSVVYLYEGTYREVTGWMQRYLGMPLGRGGVHGCHLSMWERVVTFGP